MAYKASHSHSSFHIDVKNHIFLFPNLRVILESSIWSIPEQIWKGKKRTSYDQGYVSSLSSTSSRKALWYWILSNTAYFATYFSETQKQISSPFLWPLFQCIKYLILSRSLAWSTIFAFQVVWNSHFWRMDFKVKPLQCEKFTLCTSVHAHFQFLGWP